MTDAAFSCPHCSQSLSSQGAIEELELDLTRLMICTRCGFGLDLRWSGRDHQLASPLPELLICSEERTVIRKLIPTLPQGVNVEEVREVRGLIERYTRALFRKQQTRAIFLISTELTPRYCKVIESVRALERGFMNEPAHIWILAETQPAQMFIDRVQKQKRVYFNHTPEELILSRLTEQCVPLFTHS